MSSARRVSLRAAVLVLSLGCLESGMSIARGSGSWGVKPPPGTAVDSTSPLAIGLVGAWHFDSRHPAEPRQRRAERRSSGITTLSPTQDGIGFSARTDADFFRVPDPGQILNFTTGPFSIEADFYYGAAAPGAVIVGRNNASARGYSIQTANDGVGRRIVTQLNHGGTTDVVQTGPVLESGAVNRVLVTYDGSTATIYVNGANQASGPYLPPTLGPEPFAAGRDAVGRRCRPPITTGCESATPGDASGRRTSYSTCAPSQRTPVRM